MATKLNGTSQIQAATIPLSALVSGYSIPSSNLTDGANFLKKDGSVTMTASFNFNSNTGINLAAPVNPTDAVNKAYVDQKAGGIGGIHEVQWVQNVNIAALSGLTLADGTATAGDIVLNTAQTTGSQNGPWVTSAGSWVRPTWWAAASSQVQNQYFICSGSGTTYKDTKWWVSNTSAITVDTTALTFVQDAGTVYTQGTGITISAGAISVNYGTTSTTAAAGNDSRITGALQTSALGTGVQTALAANVGSAGAPVLFNGAGGTPSAITLTNGNGLPLSGLTGFGTGVAAALAIAIGTAGAPVLLNGAGGTPTSLTLTNATGLPVGAVTGLGTGVAAALAIAVGTGSGLAQLSGGVLTAGDFPALTGDVTTTAGSLTTTINHTSGSGFTKYTDQIVGEAVTGTVNGTNTTFTLANTPANVNGGKSSLRLHLNGERIYPVTDYTISGLTITMLTAPSGSDALNADYMI